MNGELDLQFVEIALKVMVLYGGAGLVAWAIIDKIKARLKGPYSLSLFGKRIIGWTAWTDFSIRTLALALSAVVALGAWYLCVELGFFASPEPTWQSWVIHIGAVAGPATGASQFIHGLINKQK